MSVAVKICGINSEAALGAAVEGGADFAGFVFYPPSPRSLKPEAAARLARLLPPRVTGVGLFVDPDDETLRGVLGEVPLGLVQLHGRETPERAEHIRNTFGRPVMKVIKVKSPQSLDEARACLGRVDRLLFDAAPPEDGMKRLPGGNAIAFDWTALKGTRWACPWMLAGGLTPSNVAEAVAVSGAPAVDVSSGVEERPGRKSPELIRAFLSAAKAIR